MPYVLTSKVLGDLRPPPLGERYTREHVPQELIDRFYEALAHYYPCSFLNDHLFTGLHEENWIIRLPEKEREGIGTENFAPMGRVMREYVLLPLEIQDDPESLTSWLSKSIG